MSNQPIDIDSFESDIFKFYSCFGKTPINTFSSFHSNGLIKLKGTFLPVTKDFFLKELSSGESFYSSIAGFSVMDGIWIHYDEKGSIIEKRTYNYGKVKLE